MGAVEQATGLWPTVQVTNTGKVTIDCEGVQIRPGETKWLPWWVTARSTIAVRELEAQAWA